MFGRKKKQEETMIQVATRVYMMRVVRQTYGKHQAEEWGDWYRQEPGMVPPAVAELLRIPSVEGVIIRYRTGGKAEYRVGSNES